MHKEIVPQEQVQIFIKEIVPQEQVQIFIKELIRMGHKIVSVTVDPQNFMEMVVLYIAAPSSQEAS